MHALAGECRVGGKLLALAKPQTFMNDSGQAVRALVRRHGVEDLERLVIVHDELDFELGVVKMKIGGGLAGHNGLASVRNHIHATEFVRVRIGIGKPPGRGAGIDHVLRRPGKADREQLDVSIEIAADAVEMILERGAAAAMNVVNARV
jgi:PTH1 family peptidyl-tRNA hydrolase